MLLLRQSQSRRCSRCLRSLVPFDTLPANWFILERINAAWDVLEALQEVGIHRITASVLFHLHSSESVVEVVRLMGIQRQNLWLQGLLNLWCVIGDVFVVVLRVGSSTRLEVFILQPREGLRPRGLAQWRFAVE